MTTELRATVTLERGLHFQGSVGSGHQLDLDSPGVGGAGPTPMELVLTGLAGCSAMDVISILRKQRQPVQGMQVHARGERRSEHPTVFTTIQLEYVVQGSDVDPAAVTRAIDLSRERYCPVWAMLAPTVEITSAFRIVSGELEFVALD